MTNKTQLWTDEYLDARRLEGDWLADELVAKVFEKGMVDDLNAILRHTVTNEQTLTSTLGGLITKYMVESIHLPDWFDYDAYERCREMYQRYEIEIMASLLFASLPMSFACAKGAQVLVRTYRLTKNAHRRTLETLQMMRDVMEPDGLGMSGKGRRTMQKVRLLHATSRYLLLGNDDWDTSQHGVPINQEDLAGTGLLFSEGVLRTLPRLNVKLTDQQIEDYVHVWAGFTAMMGTQHELLPDTPDQATHLLDRILERHYAPSEAGEQLTESLIKMVQELLPMAQMRGLPAAMIIELNDPRVPEMLNVQPTAWREALNVFEWAAPFIKGAKADKLVMKSLERICYHLFEGRVVREMEADRASFSVPDHLTTSWKLSDLGLDDL